MCISPPPLGGPLKNLKIILSVLFLTIPPSLLMQMDRHSIMFWLTSSWWIRVVCLFSPPPGGPQKNWKYFLSVLVLYYSTVIHMTKAPSFRLPFPTSSWWIRTMCLSPPPLGGPHKTKIISKCLKTKLPSLLWLKNNQLIYHLLYY